MLVDDCISLCQFPLRCIGCTKNPPGNRLGSPGRPGDFMGNFMLDFIGSQWGFPRGSDMILILQDKL